MTTYASVKFYPWIKLFFKSREATGKRLYIYKHRHWGFNSLLLGDDREWKVMGHSPCPAKRLTPGGHSKAHLRFFFQQMVTVTLHVYEERCYHFSKEGSCSMAALWDKDPGFMAASGMPGLYSTTTPQVGIQLCVEFGGKNYHCHSPGSKRPVPLIYINACKLVGIQINGSSSITQLQQKSGVKVH